MQFRVHAAFSAPNKTSMPPFFDAQAGRCSMAFETSGVDHDRRLFAVISGQADHHLRIDAVVAPPLPTVVERLMRAILLGRISPSQATAIDENNSVQNVSITDTWLATLLGKVELKARHLRVGYPD